jgi:surface antigen
VLACGDREAGRRCLYNGTGALRLCWPLQRLTAVAALLGAVTTAGCSYQLDSLFSKADSDAEQTGSTARLGDRAGHAAAVAPPSEIDLAYARAVAADVLARGAKDSSIPWENPHTGAGGNITPLAASYSEGTFTCRDFLASYVRAESQAWLQGAACRTQQGKWEVKSLKPLKQG